MWNKTRRNKSRRCNGGGATVMPLKYYNSSAQEPSAPSGSDMLKASGNMIRPKIGGRRRRSTTRRVLKGKTRRTKGGFFPSVMGNFVASASKYIVPITLFAGYKMMTRKSSHRRK